MWLGFHIGAASVSVRLSYWRGFCIGAADFSPQSIRKESAPCKSHTLRLPCHLRPSLPCLPRRISRFAPLSCTCKPENQPNAFSKLLGENTKCINEPVMVYLVPI
jgi:hypothetical protein